MSKKQINHVELCSTKIQIKDELDGMIDTIKDREVFGVHWANECFLNESLVKHFDCEITKLHQNYEKCSKAEPVNWVPEASNKQY